MNGRGNIVLGEGLYERVLADGGLYVDDQWADVSADPGGGEGWLNVSFPRGYVRKQRLRLEDFRQAEDLWNRGFIVEAGVVLRLEETDDPLAFDLVPLDWNT